MKLQEERRNSLRNSSRRTSGSGPASSRPPASRQINLRIPMFARLLNLSALLVLLGCMFAPPLSTAQSYPQRPVRLEVGFPAGSTIDIVGRIVGKKLSERG